MLWVITLELAILINIIMEMSDGIREWDGGDDREEEEEVGGVCRRRKDA